MAEYIEREAVLKLQYWEGCGSIRYGVVDVEDIENLPAADVVERKRGRWIWDENAMDWGLGGWVCSECQEKNDNIPAKPDINPYGWVGSFFCPNCGADMRGDGDG